MIAIDELMIVRLLAAAVDAVPDQLAEDGGDRRPVAAVPRDADAVIGSARRQGPVYRCIGVSYAGSCGRWIMSDVRWATFDCFGTLVDWRHGIATGAEFLFPGRGQ